MEILDKASYEWEQLFTQYKTQAGDTVVCMIHKDTKKRVYYDAQLNRVLSKNEAKRYSLDLTGQFPVMTGDQQK